MRRTLHQESGSGLLEFALVLPVFFLLVFGFIDFALVMANVCNATFATRSALRYTSLHSQTSYVPAKPDDVTNIVTPFLLPYPRSTSKTTLSYSKGNTVGSLATIEVDLTYRLILPGLTMDAFTIRTQASGAVVQ